MLPSRLAAALMMPLLFGALRTSAQMIPVADLPPAAADTTAEASLAPKAPNPTAAISSSTVATPLPGPLEGSGGVQLPPPPPHRHEAHVGPFSTAAFGLTAGTLGGGGELAVPLARSLNLRVGGTYFNIRYPFTIDGVDYNAGMKLTSGKGVIDWFPTRGGFHVSAGALYFKNAVNAAASVVAGQQFKLGGTTYLNSVDDPVQGSASLTFPRKLAPMVLVGFGNLIPRSGRHISVPFEIGGAYLMPPQVNLQLAGTACTNQGCFNAATDPTVQANLAQEIEKLNKDIRPLQIYPIVSLGFALRF